MKLTVRKTHDFTDISVDEIETTIHKSSKVEAEALVQDLFNVIRNLVEYTDKPLIDFIEDEIQPMKNKIIELEDKAEWLSCLEAAGVDNWEGFSIAQDIQNEQY